MIQRSGNELTREQRAEFWRRFRARIEEFREQSPDCEIATNQFEVRRWDVKFTKRRAGQTPTSAAITIVEHGPSKHELLLAVTATLSVDGADESGPPELIPVFFDPAANVFFLHADQGPVMEALMPAYFARRLDDRFLI